MPEIKWEVEEDDSGLFVIARGLAEDESLPVYLPTNPEVRERAAEVIAKALNDAGIK